MISETYEPRDDNLEQSGSNRGDEKWQDLDRFFFFLDLDRFLR